MKSAFARQAPSISGSMKWCLDPHLLQVCQRRFGGALMRTNLNLLSYRESYFLSRFVDQIERVEEPSTADRLLVPVIFNRLSVDSDFCASSDLIRSILDTSPWYRPHASRYVIFMMGDEHRIPNCCDHAAVFLPSCSRHSRGMPLCYFPSPPDWPTRPIEQCDVEVGFQGCSSTSDVGIDC